MSAPRDPDRLIRAFLAEGATHLPDRTYDAVRSDIERTRQRAVIGPWRLTEMITYLKYGIAAVAVVVVAVIGINLLPAGNGQTGGPAPTASPSPTPTVAPTPSAVPTPSATATALFPPEGPLPAGTYTAVLEGIPLSFAVPPAAWTSHPGNSVGNDSYGQPDGISFNLWASAPDGVYSDPCAHTPLSPVPSHTAAGLIAAAAAMPGTDLVSGPASVTVGGRPAQSVAFTIREDIGCDPQEFYLWYDDSSGGPSGGWRWAGFLGSTHQAWAIDVDGKVVWIDAETFQGSGPEVDQAVQTFITSIQFE